MADYTEPTQNQFDSAEQSMLDIMSSAYPAIITKAGSVIRELVVRPMAYLQSWLAGNADELERRSTMEYLKNSQATDDPIADRLAGNYFVTRREGTKSKGVVTLITNTSVVQISAGSIFTAGGVTLITNKNTIAMGSTYSEDEATRYVPIFPYSSADGTFITNIPVEATETGRVELDAGMTVTLGFGSSEIVSATLTSPVTGGSDTETDAELMARAEYNTAESGIGTYYGIKKKLNNAPINVLGFSVIAGEDKPLYRARYNSVNINTGGFVDCYVKTQNQYSSALLNVTQTYEEPTSNHSIVFQSTDCAGLYGIRQLIVDGEIYNKYSISFGSDSPTTADGSGARLGVHQTMTVTFQTTGTVIDGNITHDPVSETPMYVSSVDVTALVIYMPGVYTLQNFLDSDVNRFIGQDIQVKAAVPVPVKLDCMLKYDGTVTDDIMSGIKRAMADRINAYPVGTGQLNFSDVIEAVSVSYPDAELRLPCTMSAEIILKDGSSGTFYSTAGILDIEHPVSYNHWDADVCFFSAIPDNIRIEMA